MPLMLLSATKTPQPLHANRVGNREAGRWLAHVHAGDVIVDEHSWSKFYSGLFFRDVEDKDLPPDPEAKRYTVVTRHGSHFGGVGDVADLRNETEKHAGRLVYRWPTKASSDKARVVVYERLAARAVAAATGHGKRTSRTAGQPAC